MAAKDAGARRRKSAGEEPEAGPGFDERLARLEAIVAELEDGELGLEGALERYREGVELLRGCREQLGGFRRQVEELSDAAEQALRPYADDPDATEEA
jgi:exodeoxyribonuclease VII small subunit